MVLGLYSDTAIFGLSVDSGLLFSNAAVTATKIQDPSWHDIATLVALGPFFSDCGLVCNAGDVSRALPHVYRVGPKKLSGRACRVCREKRLLFCSFDEAA